jgi:hypothetical protein
MKIERKVDERKFAAWPKFLRESFERCRTARTGPVSLKLNKVEQ